MRACVRACMCVCVFPLPICSAESCLYLNQLHAVDNIIYNYPMGVVYIIMGRFLSTTLVLKIKVVDVEDEV